MAVNCGIVRPLILATMIVQTLACPTTICTCSARGTVICSGKRLERIPYFAREPGRVYNEIDLGRNEIFAVPPYAFDGVQTRSLVRRGLLTASRHGPSTASRRGLSSDTVPRRRPDTVPRQTRSLDSVQTRSLDGVQTRSLVRRGLLTASRHGPSSSHTIHSSASVRGRSPASAACWNAST